MAAHDETSIYGIGQGCPVHGDELMKECNMCGAEFCRACFPRSSVCPDCAEQYEEGEDEEGAEDEEAEEEADFEDVSKVKDVLADDKDVEEEDEGFEPPEEDLDEEDRARR